MKTHRESPAPPIGVAAAITTNLIRDPSISTPGEAHIIGTHWDGSQSFDWNQVTSLLHTRNIDLPIANHLRVLANRLRVRKFYLPAPDFNGRMVDTHSLTKTLELDTGVQIFSGAPGDCLELPQGTAKITIGGGCGEFVATDGKRFVSAHIGFRSIFRHDEPGFPGAMVEIANFFPTKSRIRTAYFYSIRPEVFLHSATDGKYCDRNRALLVALRKRYPALQVDDRGMVDMPSLVRLECMAVGIAPPAKGVWSYLPPGCVHTRMRSPYDAMRNLLIVVRY